MIVLEDLDELACQRSEWVLIAGQVNVIKLLNAVIIILLFNEQLVSLAHSLERSFFKNLYYYIHYLNILITVNTN